MEAALSDPRVSVVLPVRDGEKYVEDAVRSILGQTFHDLEVVVVDDGSSDGTPRIIASLAEEDSRVRLERLRPTGLVGALNAGIGRASGSYIARMDADDVSLPRRIERQVAELDARPTVGVLGTQVRYVDAAGRPMGIWSLPVGEELVRWSLFFGTALAHPSVMMRRSLVEAHPYRETEAHAEDYDLWVRLARLTSLDNLPEILFERRVHGSSVSDVNETQQTESTLRVQRASIALALGREPSGSQLQALRDPTSLRDAFVAIALIWRLFRCASRTAETRRDALQRSWRALRSALSPR
jgi:glycosyltransferase involved in cell wall biosynthesis